MLGAILPFSLAQIKSIRWVPGEEACLVSFRFQADDKKTRRVKKAKLAEMDVLRPDFERMLACAAVLFANIKQPGPAIAQTIQRWDALLAGRDAPAYAYTHGQIWEWSGLHSFELGVMKPSIFNPGRTDPPKYCTLKWSSGSMASLTYALIEANSPGFIEWGTILCDGHTMPSAEAFGLRRRLENDVPYAILREKKHEIASQLRICISMGMQDADILSLLITSTIPVGATMDALPDLVENIFA